MDIAVDSEATCMFCYKYNVGSMITLSHGRWNHDDCHSTLLPENFREGIIVAKRAPMRNERSSCQAVMPDLNGVSVRHVSVCGNSRFMLTQFLGK
jgi:hypothetical protein